MIKFYVRELSHAETLNPVAPVSVAVDVGGFFTPVISIVICVLAATALYPVISTYPPFTVHVAPVILVEQIGTGLLSVIRGYAGGSVSLKTELVGS